MKTNIMVIIVENRDSKAPDVQEVLTKFGSIINARLGLHENDFNEGKIILDLVDNAEKIEELAITKYGMQRPDKNQTVYVNVIQSDYGEVVKPVKNNKMVVNAAE